MTTRLAIDDQLLSEAQTLGGHPTKQGAVNEALREYIQRRRQTSIVNLFGTIELDSSYQHEQQRRRP
jgi:hypothetical protein